MIDQATQSALNNSEVKAAFDHHQNRNRVRPVLVHRRARLIVVVLYFYQGFLERQEYAEAYQAELQEKI